MAYLHIWKEKTPHFCILNFSSKITLFRQVILNTWHIVPSNINPFVRDLSFVTLTWTGSLSVTIQSKHLGQNVFYLFFLGLPKKKVNFFHLFLWSLLTVKGLNTLKIIESTLPSVLTNSKISTLFPVFGKWWNTAFSVSCITWKIIHLNKMALVLQTSYYKLYITENHEAP